MAFLKLKGGDDLRAAMTLGALTNFGIGKWKFDLKEEDKGYKDPLARDKAERELVAELEKTIQDDSGTNGFTIVCTTSCTYYFTSYPLAGKLLGFTTNASGTSVSSNVPALLGTTGFYYLCFTNVPSANMQGNRYSFIIPNNVALGSLLTSNNEIVSDLLDFNSELSFQYLDIELRDCNYNLVALNSDWQLELDIVTK